MSVELTYCTADDAIQYLTSLPEGGQYADISDAEVRRAQADVDRQALRAHSVDPDTENGLKLTVSQLSFRQAQALSEAVADQVKFRRLFGERAMAVPEYDAVGAGSISKSGKIVKFSEEAYEKLSDAGLMDPWVDNNFQPFEGNWERWGGGWGGNW